MIAPLKPLFWRFLKTSWPTLPGFREAPMTAIRFGTNSFSSMGGRILNVVPDRDSRIPGGTSYSKAEIQTTQILLVCSHLFVTFSEFGANTPV
jgi:hypothetical protein